MVRQCSQFTDCHYMTLTFSRRKKALKIPRLLLRALSSLSHTQVQRDANKSQFHFPGTFPFNQFFFFSLFFICRRKKKSFSSALAVIFPFSSSFSHFLSRVEYENFIFMHKFFVAFALCLLARESSSLLLLTTLARRVEEKNFNFSRGKCFYHLITHNLIARHIMGHIKMFF